MRIDKNITNDRPENIGEFLKGENNQMFAAMPTPVQIYYGVQEKTADKLNVKQTSLTCPLTVREGAEWLDNVFDGIDIKETKVE